MTSKEKIILDNDVLKVLYSKGRKFYMRMKRRNNGTGIIDPYLQYVNAIGLTREEADKLYFIYLAKYYKELIRLIYDNENVMKEEDMMVEIDCSKSIKHLEESKNKSKEKDEKKPKK